MEFDKLEKFSQIVKLKENHNIEFKRATDKLGSSFWETYSSFANTEGGIIVLGVKEGKNKQEIIGVTDAEKTVKEITTGANNQDLVNRNVLRNRDVKVLEENGKSIILVRIPKIDYREKPIYLKGKIKDTYKRLHESDQLCTMDEINAMMRDSSVQALDRKILKGYDIDDIDFLTIEKYRLRMKEVNPESHFNEVREIKDFLISSGVLIKNRTTGNFELTLGGLLMFGKTVSIKGYLPHFHLEYIDKSDPKYDRWVDRIIYDGTWGEENLYNFYTSVINKLEALIKTPFKLKADNLTRDDSNDFKKAVREALLNCLIHGDYEYPVGVIITKQEKAYVFENPGLLRLTPEEILTEKLYSDPRNTLIMDLFRFIKLSERAGSGIKTILQVINELNLQKPTIEYVRNRIRFTLPDTQILDNENLTEKEKIVLAYILEHEFVQRKTIEESLGISKNMSLSIFEGLIEKRIIKRIGEGRGTKYILDK